MAFGDLCQLSDVTAWLQTGQNPFPATDDALLARLITAASQFIQSWLQRQIAVSDWIEIRDGNGGQRLTFANMPVVNVIALSIDGLTIPPAPADGAFGAGYVFSPTELALRGYVFSRRAHNVVVTYTAGYQRQDRDRRRRARRPGRRHRADRDFVRVTSSFVVPA